MYLFITVRDDALINDSSSARDDDSVEIYLDANNEKTSSYDADDFDIVLGWHDREQTRERRSAAGDFRNGATPIIYSSQQAVP